MLRRSISTFILDLLFPSFCVGCKKEGVVLCASCKGAVVIQRLPFRLKGTHASLFVYAAADYDQNIVSALIRALKYEGAREAHLYLADLILTHLTYAGFTTGSNAVITAVPLHKKRERERGFNQSELIAQRLASLLSLPYLPSLLTRIRHTKPQTELKEPSKRRANVEGAFACYNEAMVRGKTVIVVDDVTTTGATLLACAQALRKTGVRRVIAFVAAR